MSFHPSELIFVVWFPMERIIHEVDTDDSRPLAVENRHSHQRKDVVDGIKHLVFLQCMQPIHYCLAVWCVLSMSRNAVDSSCTNSSSQVPLQNFSGINARAFDSFHWYQFQQLHSKRLQLRVRKELVRICEYLLDLWKVHQVRIRAAAESGH